MQPLQYFNTNKANLDSKKHNFFIPICLGNKFFTKENTRQYLLWTLKHTKESVLFLIADTVQITNYNVRNNNSEEYNAKRVLRDGDSIESMLYELLSELSITSQNKINIIRWEECKKNNPFYYETTLLLYKEFKNNKDFADEVLKAEKLSITDKEFDEKEYNILCDYVLDEFAFVYSGVSYNKVHYDAFVYPRTDAVAQLIDDIRDNIRFPKLNKKLPSTKGALIILNHP